METIEMRIRRTDTGGNLCLLEARVYEALRKSEPPCPQGEWNKIGRQYSIKGIYNLTKTEGITAIFDNSVVEDLEEYEKQKASKK